MLGARTVGLSALLVGFLLCQPARADEIDDQLSEAKSKRQIALTAAGLHLRFAFDDVIEKMAAKGDLNSVKKLQNEQAAFKESGELPKSTEMKTGLAEYYKERRASASTMHTAYRKAISDYTKVKQFDLAKIIEADMKKFVTDETALLGPIGGGGGVATLPPGAEQTIPLIIKKFSTDMKKAVSEGTSINRKDAVRELIQDTDKALQRGTVDFRFKIVDINEYDGKFTISFQPFIGSDEIPNVDSYARSLSGISLTPMQARTIRAGNMLILRGTARLGQAYTMRSDSEICAVAFTPEMEHFGVVYGVFITKFKLSIRTDNEEIEQK